MSNPGPHARIPADLIWCLSLLPALKLVPVTRAIPRPVNRRLREVAGAGGPGRAGEEWQPLLHAGRVSIWNNGSYHLTAAATVEEYGLIPQT